MDWSISKINLPSRPTPAAYAADLAGGEPKALYEEVDDKFWSIPGQADPGAQPSPDGKWVAFISDRDGWDHLYVMPASGGAPTQITKGKFEAWRPAWSRDSARMSSIQPIVGHR